MAAHARERLDLRVLPAARRRGCSTRSAAGLLAAEPAALRARGLRPLHGHERPQLPADRASTSRSSTGRADRSACGTSTCRCCPSSSRRACSPPASPSPTRAATSRVVGLLAVVGLVFQYLLRTALSSIERKEQLEGRTRELASLQVGLLGTVLQTLSLRDKMTARHSAAVARYSREIARELGLAEREQEIVHTAALLHDIGKFIFPDSILFADTQARRRRSCEIVRRHPEQGARLVARIDGYGPVAEIILAHHERIDGNGYPNGLAGEQIPLAARIISVADTYDVMTARDSYRRPVSPRRGDRGAAARVRRAARRAGRRDLHRAAGARAVTFRHADDADFERELNLERRVPRLRGAAGRGRLRTIVRFRGACGRPIVRLINDNERHRRPSSEAVH